MSVEKVSLTHPMIGSTVRKFAVSSTTPPPSDPKRSAGPQERGDVGPAEAVDRLLGVTHDEEVPGCHVHLLPRLAPCRLVARVGGGDANGQLDLDGIGVLELVEKQPVVALVQGRPHGRAVLGVAQQRSGQDEQIVELQLAGPLAGLGTGQGEGPDGAAESTGARVGDLGADAVQGLARLHARWP